MYRSTVAEASASDRCLEKQSKAALPNKPRVINSPRRCPQGETRAIQRPTPVSPMLINARHRTISLTGSRPLSCFTHTVIRLNASELSTQYRQAIHCFVSADVSETGLFNRSNLR